MGCCDSTIENGTKVVFFDRGRQLWDTGVVTSHDGDVDSYGVRPDTKFGPDEIFTMNGGQGIFEAPFGVNTRIMTFESSINNHFGYKSILIYGGGYAMIANWGTGDVQRRCQMWVEPGNYRKLKMKFKPPLFVNGRRTYVLVFLQKDARTFSNVGSQPTSKLTSTTPIPESFLGANRMVPDPKWTPPANALPQGWISKIDPASRRPYYVDTFNQRTQWEPPPIQIPPKMMWEKPKDPEFIDGTKYMIESEELSQGQFRDCKYATLSADGLFVINGTPLVGKWDQGGGKMKLKFSNKSGLQPKTKCVVIATKDRGLTYKNVGSQRPFAMMPESAVSAAQDNFNSGRMLPPAGLNGGGGGTGGGAGGASTGGSGGGGSGGGGSGGGSNMRRDPNTGYMVAGAGAAGLFAGGLLGYLAATHWNDDPRERRRWRNRDYGYHNNRPSYVDPGPEYGPNDEEILAAEMAAQEEIEAEAAAAEEVEEPEPEPEDGAEAADYMEAGAGPDDRGPPRPFGFGHGARVTYAKPGKARKLKRTTAAPKREEVEDLPPLEPLPANPEREIIYESEEDEEQTSDPGSHQWTPQKLEFSVQKYDTDSFVWKTKKRVESTAIEIVTQMSLDRMEMLEKMVASWDGLISVAIYIERENVEAQKSFISEFWNRIEAQPDNRGLDIHLLYESASSDDDDYYPINNLRNLALQNARASYVLLLDVDFTVHGVSPTLSDSAKVLLDGTSIFSTPRNALVIPALEKVDDSVACGNFHDLTRAYLDGKIAGFHTKNFPAGHAPTQYKTWLNATTPFEVEYKHCFEPYVIMRKDQVPKYDERFRGYGMNKIVHLLAVSQFATFHVMPKAWVMAVPHERSRDWHRTIQTQGKETDRLAEMQELFEIAKKEIAHSNLGWQQWLFGVAH